MQQRFCSFGGARESLKLGPLSITIEDTAAHPPTPHLLCCFVFMLEGGGSHRNTGKLDAQEDEDVASIQKGRGSQLFD